MQDQFKAEQWNAKHKGIQIKQDKDRHLNTDNLWKGNRLRVLYVRRWGWSVYHWGKFKHHTSDIDHAIEVAERMERRIWLDRMERAEKRNRPSVPITSGPQWNIPIEAFMKKKPSPPQFELPHAEEVFNLQAESTTDGERLRREAAAAADAKEQQDKQQQSLL